MKGKCEVCRGHITIRKDETLMLHKGYRSDPDYCLGSRTKPVRKVA